MKAADIGSSCHQVVGGHAIKPFIPPILEPVRMSAVDDGYAMAKLRGHGRKMCLTSPQMANITF
jgi:hypothetical protein